jgi:hypothetical protein
MIGGFPIACLDTCNTPGDCLMEGCKAMSEDHEKQPAPVFFTCGPHEHCPHLEKCVIALP